MPLQTSFKRLVFLASSEKTKRGEEMKKLSILFVLMLLLSACGQQNERQEGETMPIFTVDAREETEQVTFVLMMKNETEDEITFEFPSSQLYEITVLNDEGKEVYRYSTGKMFTQAIQTESISAKDVKVWEESWNYMYDGERVRRGEYTVKVEWKGFTKDGENELTATETFNVPSVHPSFSNVKVEKKDDSILITGEIKTAGKQGSFVIEDGHYELHKGTIPVDKQNEWTSFSISVLKEEIESDRKPYLLLYTEESKDPFIVTIDD